MTSTKTQKAALLKVTGKTLNHGLSSNHASAAESALRSKGLAEYRKEGGCVFLRPTEAGKKLAETL